jgi:hypothetical protein
MLTLSLLELPQVYPPTQNAVILSGASRSFIARGVVEGPAFTLLDQWSQATPVWPRKRPLPSVSWLVSG